MGASAVHQRPSCVADDVAKFWAWWSLMDVGGHFFPRSRERTRANWLWFSSLARTQSAAQLSGTSKNCSFLVEGGKCSRFELKLGKNRHVLESWRPPKRFVQSAKKTQMFPENRAVNQSTIKQSTSSWFQLLLPYYWTEENPDQHQGGKTGKEAARRQREGKPQEYQQTRTHTLQ